MIKLVVAAVSLGVLAACSAQPSNAGREDQPPAGAVGSPSVSQPSGPVPVGQAVTMPDRLEITITRVRVAPVSAVDPALYRKPAGWTGILIEFTLRNGTPHAVTLQWGLEVTAGENDVQGDFVVPDLPGAVMGISWVGDTPLLAGKTRKGTTGAVVASKKSITLTSTGDDVYPAITFVGDAS